MKNLNKLKQVRSKIEILISIREEEGLSITKAEQLRLLFGQEQRLLSSLDSYGFEPGYTGDGFTHQEDEDFAIQEECDRFRE